MLQLAEMTFTVYRPGNRLLSGHHIGYDSVCIVDGEIVAIEDYTEDAPAIENPLGMFEVYGYSNYSFTKKALVVSIRPIFIGDPFSGYNVLAEEITAVGPYDTLEPAADVLWRIAQRLQENRAFKKVVEEEKVLDLVPYGVVPLKEYPAAPLVFQELTMWKYESWETHSFDGVDYDSELTFLGLVSALHRVPVEPIPEKEKV